MIPVSTKISVSALAENRLCPIESGRLATRRGARVSVTGTPSCWLSLRSVLLRIVSALRGVTQCIR